MKVKFVPGVPELPIKVVKTVWKRLIEEFPDYPLEMLTNPEILDAPEHQGSEMSYIFEGPGDWRCRYTYDSLGWYAHQFYIYMYTKTQGVITHSGITIDCSFSGSAQTSIHGQPALKVYVYPKFHELYNYERSKKAMGDELGGLLDL